MMFRKYPYTVHAILNSPTFALKKTLDKSKKFKEDLDALEKIYNLEPAEQLKQLQEFKQAGLDVHAIDSSGRTHLHWAAASNSPTAVKFFLDEKLNVNQKDTDKMTPLHCAAQSRHAKTAEIIEILAQNGAKMNAEYKYDYNKTRTALYLASHDLEYSDEPHQELIIKTLEPLMKAEAEAAEKLKKAEAEAAKLLKKAEAEAAERLKKEAEEAEKAEPVKPLSRSWSI